MAAAGFGSRAANMNIPSRQGSTEGLGPRDGMLLAAIAAIGLACYLPAIGQTKHWRSHETRHAQIAREMTMTGEYAVPRLAGKVYVDKPPMYHWLTVCSYGLLGRTDLFAARLPSAIGAVGRRGRRLPDGPAVVRPPGGFSCSHAADRHPALRQLGDHGANGHGHDRLPARRQLPGTVRHGSEKRTGALGPG